MSGTFLLSFVISSTLDRAKQVIEDQEMLRLSNRDRNLFLSALKDPPEPNNALTSAVKHYNELLFS